MTAIAVSIAGSDSSGGAGLQADLKTFSAFGVYGATIITALTAQNTRGVDAIHNVPTRFVSEQIDSVFSDLTVNAVKIGMLSEADIICAVAEGLQRHNARAIVLDPVMVATSGDVLLNTSAIDTLRRVLLPMADLITPNLPEAAELLDEPLATDEDAMLAQAHRLLAHGPQAVLVKGGHGTGETSVDILVTQKGTQSFSAPRISTRNTHGTGCTLSAAIAAGLAKGMSLPDAIASAKSYLTAALIKSDKLTIGHGSGPVHHFHALWS